MGHTPREVSRQHISSSHENVADPRPMAPDRPDARIWICHSQVCTSSTIPTEPQRSAPPADESPALSSDHTRGSRGAWAAYFTGTVVKLHSPTVPSHSHMTRRTHRPWTLRTTHILELTQPLTPIYAIRTGVPLLNTCRTPPVQPYACVPSSCCAHAPTTHSRRRPMRS